MRYKATVIQAVWCWQKTGAQQFPGWWGSLKVALSGKVWVKTPDIIGKKLKWTPDLYLTLKLGMDSSFVLFLNTCKYSPGGGNIDKLIL